MEEELGRDGGKKLLVIELNPVGLVDKEGTELPTCEPNVDEDKRLVIVLGAPPVDIEEDAEALLPCELNPDEVENFELLETDFTELNEEETEAIELKACTVDRNEDPKLELLEGD
jgi:hypothetical protein